MVNSDFAESKFHAAILVCKQRRVNRQTCLCKNFINVHYCLIIIKIVSDSLQRKLSLQLSLLLDHIHRNTNILWNYQLKHMSTVDLILNLELYLILVLDLGQFLGLINQCIHSRSLTNTYKKRHGSSFLCSTWNAVNTSRPGNTCKDMWKIKMWRRRRVFLVSCCCGQKSFAVELSRSLFDSIWFQFIIRIYFWNVSCLPMHTLFQIYNKSNNTILQTSITSDIVNK